MADTPTRAFPIISESTVIRTKIGTLIVIAVAMTSGLIGGTLFVSHLTAYMDSSERRLTRIENALGIDSWKYVPPMKPALP